MRRVFRKVFRVLRHPLTALVAFLYVGWAVWQAPAATLVGDLAPGVRSFTRYQNFETAFVGYMYPVDGGYELITRRDCDGRLPEYSAADYSAMEMWYFVVGFQARWWGIFDQSICVTGAGAHYTVEPFGTDRSANRQLWNPVSYPSEERRRRVQALTDQFFDSTGNDRIDGLLREMAQRDAVSREYTDDVLFIDTRALVYETSVIFVLVCGIVAVVSILIRWCRDTAAPTLFATRGRVLGVRDCLRHPMSMGISLLVLAGVSMTVPRGSWYGDGVARMSELHPATEYVHDLFRPDYEINIHHLIRPPRLPWHLTYLSDEYGAIQGWIIPGTHEAVVVEYNDSYLFDDTDRSRPGLYRYLIRFEHSRSGFMFTHFLNRTVVKQGIYTQYIDTNKPHQRNTYSIEKDVDPQEAQEYHELLLLRVQEQGRQGITGIDVDHVLRQKLKAGIYDDPVIVNSVVWMG